MNNQIILPQLAWHGVRELKLSFPQGWQVEVCNMAGHNKPRLKANGIKKAINNPIGMAPLCEYARDKKEVVIIFDDMTRVTRVKEIVPHVLSELSEAGITDNQIRFIAAIGCHGALNRTDFVKKLGEEVLKRFPVYNHNPFENCVYAGTISSGIRLNINAEVMKCDLKIGIGSVVPHIMAGFGGGSKIILPGIAAYETILALHSPRENEENDDYSVNTSSMGVLNNNTSRRDIDETADIIGLDMKIDGIVNMWGETVALFAGKPRHAYATALEAAKSHYLTPSATDKDIVVANCFAKVNEAFTGLPIAFTSVRPRGGDVVLIANAPEGQVTHYLLGPFGNTIAGRRYSPLDIPPNVNRLIIYNEYPEITGLRYIAPRDKVVMLDDWDDVLSLLKKSHGSQAKVAVYPNANIQYTA